MTAVESVRLSRRRLLVNGRPELVFAGEVHYFRLHRRDWADRLDRLVEAGCTAVASYMPWLVHERPDGEIDLRGNTSEYRDLVGFLDLAAERDLLVIARPGPFVMAELKNEGIPYRVYREHPEILPVGWDGRPGTTRTVDYLADGFLTEVDRWYAQIMPVLAERQVSRGGPVAAVQLDNEIGMLSWVSNTPELTDQMLSDFAVWSVKRWGSDGVQARHGLDPDDVPAWRHGVRSPAPGSLALHHDLSEYHRDRYDRYVTHLRANAESHGLTDVPFLINIHGTGGGRGRTYPIGISQLYPSYRGKPQLTSGSDHYLGDLTVENVADLYVMNAFMAAVHDEDQPLTSLEFEAGLGDYGEDLSRQVPPEALALKTRLCVAQANRLVNYYLFAGGHNPPLEEKVGDGNDRIAFTGERHGFTAPIGPEGAPNASYPVLRDTVTAVSGAGHLLADMDEEYDDLALAFVPDHYLTEYAHPGDDARGAVVAELEQFRGMGSRDVVARAMLLGGFSFPAVDVQSDLQADLDTDPAGGAAAGRAIVLTSASTLAAPVQQRLADFVLAGGRLLLAGMVPTRDTDGSACTILGDALGVRGGATVAGNERVFPSVRAEGWTTAHAEVRVGVLQHLELGEDAQDAEVFARETATGNAVAVEVHPGRGHALVLACDYICDLDFWRALLARLGVRPRYTHDATAPGIVVTSTVDGDGQRLLHLINVGPVDQSFVVSDGTGPLFDGARVHLPARSGRILPLNVRTEDGVLAWSTCELAGVGDGALLLRRNGAGDAFRFQGRDPRTWPDAPDAAGQVVAVE
ncbi:beta-galactosidase [Actinopolymorpha cephalotaxi]|uniref:Beta-galactosidase n=1 Tax=Actinopolymorpha cephalotaxi TaxID=504797 RepID=A0A1I2PJ64_9ACTN|nr:beta-galactosidase [Actinopolymorpha cephalotaxi]NYH83674.1 beta-galactosidase [Actinopolymorpha cephalotaxi]SFG13461.1 beta-galactosidase [Actinopolymorpha cephalotaxi]